MIYLIGQQRPEWKEVLKQEYHLKAINVFTDNQYGNVDKVVDYDTEDFSFIEENSLVFLFFPCIYFSRLTLIHLNIYDEDSEEVKQRKLSKITEYYKNREYYMKQLERILKILVSKNSQIIFETPFGNYLMGDYGHYLMEGGKEKWDNLIKSLNVSYDKILLKDRRELGDDVVKKTYFCFINVKPKTKPTFKKIGYPAGTMRTRDYYEKRKYTPLFIKNFIDYYIDHAGEYIKQHFKDFFLD